MQQGSIDHWNDSKGFGFIRPDGGGERLFFHISAYRGQGRPQLGERVSFEPEIDAQSRPRASSVHPLKNATHKRAKQPKATSQSALVRLLLIAVVLLGLALLWQQFGGRQWLQGEAPTAQLQQNELTQTLTLIRQGGPYPYPQDGSVFQNRERQLPAKPRGYYREYTVDTPGLSHRGARRVVTGGDPPEVWYYTEDHYRSFRQLEAP